jgi:hypothetical protein
MARKLTYYLEPNNIVWINDKRVKLLQNEPLGHLFWVYCKGMELLHDDSFDIIAPLAKRKLVCAL